mmetsp:Transcript_532/g.787  ORF Transcript_532/g.787 Transcript_532/m.787 type:complete len:86 (+) Transcript_532:276-533(+)
MEAISKFVSGRDLLDPEEDEPIIKAFHCWEIVWDSGASSMVGKVQKLGMSPTKLLVKDKRILAVEMRRVPAAVTDEEETEECLVR